MQWNHFKKHIARTKESVFIRKVSSFKKLILGVFLNLGFCKMCFRMYLDLGSVLYETFHSILNIKIHTLLGCRLRLMSADVAPIGKLSVALSVPRMLLMDVSWMRPSV